MNKSWFVMTSKTLDLSAEGWGEEANVRFPKEFAEKFICEYTNEGDVVFDPFAGFGTTLFVAQKLGRIGLGIEWDQKKFEYINEKLNPPSAVIHGDSRRLDEYDIPSIDFSLTSPPFMRSFDQNPLNNDEGDYQEYLSDIQSVYVEVKALMKLEAVAVVEVQNTFEKGYPMTTLAWDVAREISKVLYLERDVIYCFQEGDLESEKTNHSYCLIFKNK